MTQPSPVRLAQAQSVATKAKQALMIATQELEALVYRQPYHLGYEDQRADLAKTLHDEFGRIIELPAIELSAKRVAYLIVVDGDKVPGQRGKTVKEPILLAEDEVLPWVFAYVFGRLGRKAAERVSYRADMLTTPL